MTATTAASAAYIVSALLFVLALAGLSKHETAKAGNTFGIAGMTVALAATIGLATRSISAGAIALIAVGMAVGAVIGPWRARRGAVNRGPPGVARLPRFAGGAPPLVGWGGAPSLRGGGGRRD